MTRHQQLAVGLAAGLACLAAGSARAATPTLQGTVGPSFSIALTQNGKAVKKLSAGTYKIVVADKASIHNFVLEQAKGGSFEKDLTSVPFTGTKTVTVKLTAGKWEFYCRPHESVMHGEFTVS